MKKVQKALLPANEEAQFQVTLRIPEGSSLAATDIAAERVARDIRRLDSVEYTLMSIGDNDQRTQNLASIYVRLKDPALRAESQQAVMDRVRQELLPKYTSTMRMAVLEVPAFNTGQSSANIQYIVGGPDLDRIADAVTKAMPEIQKIPGIRDVDSTLIEGKPELRAVVDRSKAGQMGVNIADLSATLRLLVGGDDVSTYDEGGEQYDIHLRSEEAYRNSIRSSRHPFCSIHARRSRSTLESHHPHQTRRPCPDRPCEPSSPSDDHREPCTRFR
jgi:HAE1 family hydrophobic/amphiphilic exporter-1